MFHIRFKKLNTEMINRSVKVTDIADALGLHRTTVYKKLEMKSPLLFQEACIIRNAFFKDMNIMELFKEQADEKRSKK